MRPIRNVNFSINVGTAVPSSVRFYPVTRAMIDVYPQYRGYHFVVVEEEIIIIEPRTRKIVQVMPHRGGGGQAAMRSKLKLSDQQRNVIRSSVRRPAATTGSATVEKEITIGDTLPETVVIERFPDTVYRSVPSMRSYQYIGATAACMWSIRVNARDRSHRLTTMMRAAHRPHFPRGTEERTQ